MKKILLTGSEGYIGTRLAQTLIREGFDITGLDTGFFEDGHLFTMKDAQKYPIVHKDIRDVTAVDVKGYDAVVHLAELSNDPLGQNDPAVTFDVNHGGTVKLADASRAAGVGRFIYFSSCSVYGASETVSDEKTRSNPLTAYAQSKVKNEAYLRGIADDSFSPVIFRNATVFGASPRMRFDLVVNDLSGHAWVDKIIKMDSDGTPWRPFVHIEDVAQAVVLTLRAPRDRVHNTLFNIGSNDNNYQIRQIAERIAEVFPGCTTQFGSLGGDKRNYRVNFDLIGTILPDFRCEWDVTRGARELKQVFEEIGFTREQFESRLYTRLKQLEYLKSEQKVSDSLRWK